VPARNCLAERCAGRRKGEATRSSPYVTTATIITRSGLSSISCSRALRSQGANTAFVLEIRGLKRAVTMSDLLVRTHCDMPPPAPPSLYLSDVSTSGGVGSEVYRGLCYHCW
jgi:hypothetical protein